MSFDTPRDDRYFEDYLPGSVHRCGEIAVEEEEVLAFARRFDPQIFHTDPQAAAEGPFGGLIASGWHTAGLMMRLLTDHYLSDVSSLASPGIEQLRWLRPVRPGDVLSVTVSVRHAVASRSKPDRGIVTSAVEVTNQRDEPVMTMTAVNMIARRPTERRDLLSANGQNM